MRRFGYLGLFLAVFMGLAACGNKGTPTNPTKDQTTTPPTTSPPPAATLSSVAITGSRDLTGQKDTVQLKVTATYSDNSTKDVTADATWSSSNSAVLTVDKGVVTAVGVGSADIKATYNDKSATATIKVNQAALTKIEIAGGNVGLSDIGQTQQLRCDAVYADGTKGDVTSSTVWRSDNPLVVSVSTGGKLTSNAAGKVQITASYQGRDTTITAEVTIPIIGGPGTPSIGFTSVPHIGSFDDLHGTVSHVKAADYRVVVFIQVDGAWWVKPYFNQILTTINADGSWVCDITTGGIDEKATSIAAFLVVNGYAPSAINVGGSMPISVDGHNVVAVVTVNR